MSTTPGEGPRSILIFGGTFDPPHRAHAMLPPLVADQLGCDLVVYVPAAVNPLKSATPPTPAEHRLAMLTIALADVPRAEISALEIERGGPSYTVDTLRELRGRFGADAKLYLLIGADQALSFHQWREWREIERLAEPVVMLRPPWTRRRFAEELRAVYADDETERWLRRLVRAPLLEVEATTIRKHLRQGESVDGAVDPAVLEYIRANNLYALEETPRGV